MTDRESPWLSDDQQTAWRAWLALNGELPALLHRRLQADSGLSLPDFEVLVQLSEADEPRLRVSPLAAALGWERSRLSHHLKRMEGRGLVGREECEDDGRGAWVTLTDAGRRAITQAAPPHARVVRELLFDDLSADDLAVITRFTTGVLERVRDAAGPASASRPARPA
ncbi:MarR family winged helix-turn-helix transcriptional regulator [Nocardioides marinquilinus]|uniref:MarR family winged helix-turn-helix transcriptional regulator n=1 Tax=Nocardioides marinquilinus TaxID=1210400 RepID=A0ABP9Q1R6_9ACTN